MPVILVDANIEGHGAYLWAHLQSESWRELAVAIDVRFCWFREVGLDTSAADNVIWRFCQEKGFYLLTSNRNADSAESLEATIQREGLPTSYPVFTLPSPDRVFHDAVFRDRVIEKLLDFCFYASNIRGAGRLFLP